MKTILAYTGDGNNIAAATPVVPGRRYQVLAYDGLDAQTTALVDAVVPDLTTMFVSHNFSASAIAQTLADAGQTLPAPWNSIAPSLIAVGLGMLTQHLQAKK